MPKALHIGSERGATLLIGGKAPVVKGAMIGWVLVPFIKLVPPYTELKEIIDKLTDWWADNGKTRERIGELIDRVGLSKFLKAVGLTPLPQMVRAPRANPYIFWSEKEVTKNE
jgi:sulfite reductase alpha subunit